MEEEMEFTFGKRDCVAGRAHHHHGLIVLLMLPLVDVRKMDFQASNRDWTGSRGTGEILH